MFHRRISVDLNLVFQVNVIQFEIINRTVGAPNNKLFILLRLLSLLSNAKPTYVVLTTGWNEHSIEVSQAYRAAVLVNHLLFSVGRVFIHIFDVSFGYWSFNAYLVSLSHFIWVTCSLIYLHYLIRSVLSNLQRPCRRVLQASPQILMCSSSNLVDSQLVMFLRVFTAEVVLAVIQVLLLN